jgi:hypothetical protein
MDQSSEIDIKDLQSEVEEFSKLCSRVKEKLEQEEIKERAKSSVASAAGFCEEPR